jgi:hypothetical protein
MECEVGAPLCGGKECKSAGGPIDLARAEGSDDPEYDASRLMPDHNEEASDRDGSLGASGNGRSAAEVGGTIPAPGDARSRSAG